MGLIQTRGSRHWKASVKTRSYKTITLENATKNADVLGHYIAATDYVYGDMNPFASHYNVSDVRNSDYTLLFGGTGRRLWTKSGSVYSDITTSSPPSNVAFLLKSKKYTKVDFDYKFNTSYSSSNCFIRTTMVDTGVSNAVHYQGISYIDNQKGNSAPVINSFFSYNCAPNGSSGKLFRVNDTNWHHATLEIEQLGNEIDCFSVTTHYADISLKNFVFTYVEDD